MRAFWTKTEVSLQIGVGLLYAIALISLLGAISGIAAGFLGGPSSPLFYLMLGKALVVGLVAYGYKKRKVWAVVAVLILLLAGAFHVDGLGLLGGRFESPSLAIALLLYAANWYTIRRRSRKEAPGGQLDQA